MGVRPWLGWKSIGLLPAVLSWCLVVHAEEVLFPVSTGEIGGAFGSRWVTQHFVRNDGEDTAQMFRFDNCRLGFCQVLIPSGQTVELEPFDNYFSVERTSLLIDVATGGSGLKFSSFVRDVSRSIDPWGTEVPVVLESDYEAKVQLVGVPADERFRLHVRLFTARLVPDPTRGEPVSVTIKVFEIAPMGSSASDLLLGSLSQEVRGSDGFLSLPSLREFVPGIAGASRLRIEILPPADSPVRLWAMVSATNNETQHVVIVAPAVTLDTGCQ